MQKTDDHFEAYFETHLIVIHAECESQNNLQNTEFQYCTECIITGENINHKKLHENLQQHGDSLVIAGSKRKAKIHIHANDPTNIFKICANWGTISANKTDDMWQQQKIVKDKEAIIKDLKKRI